MRLRFLGAAGEVTGSSFLIETGELRFLVDCGLFQGGREAEEKNRAPFPFRPRDLDFVLLTHAHLDHGGRLPLLTRGGFAGSIYATAATIDLLHILLRDSARIQADEGPEPLYTLGDVEASLGRLRPVTYDEVARPHPSVRCRFRDAGHILGSAIVETWVQEAAEEGSGGGEREVKLVFSGDLGQPGRPIVRDPTRVEEADALLVESTYADREHRDLQATLDELVEVVRETVAGGGNVVVPAFAVGRTQEILYYLNTLSREGRLRDLRVFVDSPMATAVTEVTLRHFGLFDREARRLAAAPPGAGAPRIRFVESVGESKRLNAERGAILLSASGMCEGGRVRHHLRHNLPRPEGAVAITGFQARGTLGRELVDGASEVTLFGERVPVRARVVTLGGFSAHADRQALLGWLGGFHRPPARTFAVHGEEAAARALAVTLRDEWGWAASVPGHREAVEL